MYAVSESYYQDQLHQTRTQTNYPPSLSFLLVVAAAVVASFLPGSLPFAPSLTEHYQWQETNVLDLYLQVQKQELVS